MLGGRGRRGRGGLRHRHRYWDQYVHPIGHRHAQHATHGQHSTRTSTSASTRTSTSASTRTSTSTSARAGRCFGA